MNIPKISSLNFNGVYLSNNLAPGKQRELGKQMMEALNSSDMADTYERQGKDILINPAPDGGIRVVTAKHTAKRLVNDNYSRWNGRF